MVSPEILRRYPFFGGLTQDQLTALAKIGQDEKVEEGHVFFHEDGDLAHFYLTLEGAVAIVMELPSSGKHTISEQFMRDYKTDSIVVSTVGTGDTFGWSALIPPHTATAGAKALTPCRVVAFPTVDLTELFEADCAFGFQMTKKAAQVIRQRLRDLRIESLAQSQE